MEDDDLEKEPKKKGFDDDADEAPQSTGLKVSRKKILIIFLPILLIAGGVVSYFTIFSQNLSNNVNEHYKIIQKPEAGGGSKTETLVFYDLPEIDVHISNAVGLAETLKMRISLELSKPQDILIIEGMTAPISDIVINHTMDLISEELNDANDFYWLKQELLYRINLITDPIVVTSISFKGFEIEGKKNN